MYRLRKLINSTDMNVPKDRDCSIRGLSYDSRKIKKGDLFFAVPGQMHDGSRYIPEAIRNGAAAAITESRKTLKENADLPVFFTRDIQKSMSHIADNFYGHPSRKLSVIGITGTNGKTTITYFLENIYRCAGIPSGVIGTINYRYRNTTCNAPTTTPQAVDLHALLNTMRARRIKNIFMEVSSHALTLQRVADIRFRGVVFTNLTRDHLDFHHTMEEYFQAKKLLFRGMNKKSTVSDFWKKFAIINTDDPYGQRIRRFLRFPVVTCGMRHNQDIQARNVRLSPQGSAFFMKVFDKEYPVTLHLIGEYNVYNALIAAGTALSLGIPLEKTLEGIRSLEGIPGRMEKVPGIEPFTVIIDYAHTGDALLNVLRAIHRVKPRRILTVFGCGGDRDRKKRPIMGRIAVEQSYHAWVTLDNPRREDPDRIVKDIIAGIKKTGKRNYSVVYDRKKAIASALHRARCGDVVLIAGKGHERYQILKDAIIPFDDKKVVGEIMRS